MQRALDGMRRIGFGVLGSAVFLPVLALAANNFTGTWSAEVRGLPAVVLQIREGESPSCGTMTFYTITSDERNAWHQAGSATQQIYSCQANQNTLIFKAMYYATPGKADLREYEFQLLVEDANTSILSGTGGYKMAEPLKMQRK